MGAVNDICIWIHAHGIHGAGAAKTALEKHGAVLGEGYGHHGNSFAIPTKDGQLKTLVLWEIEKFVIGFNVYAYYRKDLQFKVTRIGTGLAGLSGQSMAELFRYCLVSLSR